MMYYAPYNPDSEATRMQFYFSAALTLISGILLLFIGESDQEFAFSLGIIISGLLYLIVGVFILYAPKMRDSIFGLTTCPSCKKNKVSVKEKLKSKVYGRRFSRCNNCKKYFSLPWYSLLQRLLLIFTPIFGLMVFQSILAMFLVMWFSCLLYLFYYGRYLLVV